ncbi:MAG: hypothetical protein ABJC89_05275 [Acidobacteriota bacterium]
MRASAAAALAVACWLMPSPAPAAQAGSYDPKNGVFSLKALVFGGGFRVTTAIPLHGDFSKFDRVEIVEAESLVGPDAPSAFLHRLTEQLAAEFRKGKRFLDVAIVERYRPPPDATVVDGSPDQNLFRTADSLDAPLRGAQDLIAMDRQRDAAEQQRAGASLVVKSEVIDYSKGNKFLQLLFMNWGNALVTLRLSYLDGATGEELGRSVISSDNSSKVVPSLFSTRTALSGVAEGLVDQVTRRKLGAER